MNTTKFFTMSNNRCGSSTPAASTSCSFKASSVLPTAPATIPTGQPVANGAPEKQIRRLRVRLKQRGRTQPGQLPGRLRNATFVEPLIAVGVDVQLPNLPT